MLMKSIVMTTLDLISQCPQVRHFLLESSGYMLTALSLLDFRYPPPQGDKYIYPGDEIDVFSPNRHIYSRYTQVNSTRVEKVLGDLHVSTLGVLCHLSTA